MTKSEYVILSEQQHEVTLVCSEPDSKTGLAIPKAHIKRFERYSRYTHKPNCELIGKYFNIPRMSNVEEETLETNLTLPFNRESLMEIFPENLVNKTLEKMLDQGTPKFSTWLAKVHSNIDENLSWNQFGVKFSWAAFGIALAVIIILGWFLKKFFAQNSNGGTGSGQVVVVNGQQ